MKRYFMGIDVGTYESKGLIMDADCTILHQASARHGLDNPQPGWYEHDAEEVWWADVCRISRQLLADSGLEPAQIECVGLSALGCDCVPVDENCNALSKAILYGIDSRATEEIAQIEAYYGDRFGEVFREPLVSSSIAPKILWFKNHMPEVYARATKFLTGSSFLTAKMTGHYCIDKYLTGGFAPLYLEDGSINEAECALFCRPDQLAEVTRAPQIVGTVTEQAARQTGLAVGTKVLTGTGDSGAESFSCGLFQPGSIMIQMGSTFFFIYNTDQAGIAGDYLIPGTYCLGAGTNNAGTLTRWFRDNLFPELLAAEEAGGENAYGAMAKLIEAIPAGSEGLMTLPYLAGERAPIDDPFAKGLIFGLQSRHTAAHIYRSALEGVCYAAEQYFQQLYAQGLPVERVLAVGGGTRNEAWLQILADMLGKEIQVPEITVGASYGDALLCALACGCYEDTAQLSEKIRIAKVIRPIPENHALYGSRKPVFRALYESTRDWMHLDW